MTVASTAEQSILTRWLFLRLLGLVHLSAFASYAFQIIGLNGSHGIVPSAALLASFADRGPIAFYELPTLEWLQCSDLFVQSLSWVGVVVSLLIVLGVTTGPALLAAMLLWLSLVSGGGEFTQFQSDGMLVEATFLSLFIVPWTLFEPPWPVPSKFTRLRPPTCVGIWLLRFMIFRLMFAAGVVKIVSGDPTWANLTALQYHFETQPIPTPLAWYANQLPQWLLKFGALGMFFVELILPPLIFVSRTLRILAACGIILIHLGIELTGNYTFLNLLAIALCVPLLDDRALRCILPAKIVQLISRSSVPHLLPIAEMKDSEGNKASNGEGFTRYCGAFQSALFSGTVGLLFFFAGAQLLSTITPVPMLVRKMLIAISPLDICNRYGLFAVMTTRRPELVFECSDDLRTWYAYEFKYKVGDDLKREPLWIAPHMPRLDWRLWFAAMEPVGASPWVLSLVKRMLRGEPDVLPFFCKLPFASRTPKYIRAFVYDYHFTNYEQRKTSGDWWWRENKRVYLPPVFLKDGKLRAVIEQSSDELPLDATE